MNRWIFCWGYNCLVIIVVFDNIEKVELDFLKKEILKMFENVFFVFNDLRIELIEVECFEVIIEDDEDECV